MNARRLMVMLGALLPMLWADVAPASSPPRIEFFYSEGCETCERINKEILPLLEARHPGTVDLVRYDIDIDTNYLRLAEYQEQISIDPHATSALIVNGRRAFTSWPSIQTEFLDTIDQLVAGAIPAEPPPTKPATPPTLNRLSRRVKGFTLVGVALAGLIDGVNPCAISTLVFLISMLSVMKVTGRRLILAGIAFCVTSFLTYLGIGFGLFRVLYLFVGFPILRRGFEVAIIGTLLVLAILSVYDALCYRRKGQAEDLVLKLPGRARDAIHRIIRSGLTTHRILWGSIMTAFLVTVLESVCTGQVYVPTLVLVLRSGESVPLVVGYLLLYNTLFILPLVGALILAYHGTRTDRFLRWSRENVIPSKLALAALFVALALLIAIL